MKDIKIEGDIPVSVPEKKSENVSITFSAKKELKEAFKYYLKYGYVVINGIFTKQQINDLNSAWEEEVKKFKGYLIRQSSDIPEKNKLNDKKWIMNSLQHIQNLPEKDFPKLTSYFLENICDNKTLAELVSYFIKGKPRLVQSMFFEGNTATKPHQDSYYLDDEIIGRMAACWIALEDIDWNSGRFFVCPKSHTFDDSKITKENTFRNQNKYISYVYQLIKDKGYEIRAPFLKKGDVLIWNSLTIHGALPDSKPINSRKSITVHFTRSNTKFRTFRYELKDLNVEERKYIDVHRLFSYDNPIFKFKLFTQRKFPNLKSRLKDLLFRIKYLRNKD